MHFRLPLQIGILVHLIGPYRRVQLEAAGDGDDFLAVGYAPRADNARHGDALGLAKIGVRKFSAAAGAQGVTRDW